MEKKVRVRFAPSPTGPLHIGGVRTALFNYLFAKQNNGDILLRIEDTDRTRFIDGAEEYIVEAFRWLGIEFDEGIGVGGQLGPYRQSERKGIYKDYAMFLVNNGKAYYAFDTAESLAEKRTQAEQAHKNFQYDSITRLTLKNSLTMDKDEVEQLMQNNTPYVIRFLFPENTDIEFDDLIRGHITMNTSILDDKVLYKSDGMPTYHLANVVDDHLMNISHVIRGEEWLSSTPLHIALYDAFGWKESMPSFAHLPLLLKPDGKGKLSKRDGDRLGFPVFPLQWTDPKTKEISSGYRESGYLPDAVINMLALLGWNDGTEQEMFSLEELIKKFSIERISKHGAKFDLEKAKWFNHQYLQKVDDNVLAKDFIKTVEDRGIKTNLDYVTKVVSLVKERCSFAKELWQNSDYFFIAPTEYNDKALKKRWKEGTNAILKEITSHIETIEDNDWAEKSEEYFMGYINEKGLNMGAIMNSIRIAVVGDAKGVDMKIIMSMLGKEETIERLKTAINKIKI